MKRCLVALSALASLASPAVADVCSAAADAATRAALAEGQRTSIVRIECGGARQTFVLHQVGTGPASSILVREVTKSDARIAAPLYAKRDFSTSSSARVVRVHR